MQVSLGFNRTTYNLFLKFCSSEKHLQEKDEIASPTVGRTSYLQQRKVEVETPFHFSKLCHPWLAHDKRLESHCFPSDCQLHTVHVSFQPALSLNWLLFCPFAFGSTLAFPGQTCSPLFSKRNHGYPTTPHYLQLRHLSGKLNSHDRRDASSAHTQENTRICDLRNNLQGTEEMD